MKLNAQQMIATQSFDNPMLIVAGAGTGKTSTIVSKILHAIQTGFAMPNQILVTTFTNKAAQELKNRLHSRLGPDVNQMFIGTFHSISLEILQRHFISIGNDRTVSVLPYEDQVQIVRSILIKLNLRDLKPTSVLEKIQKYKESKNPRFAIDNRVFTMYQAELNHDKMMDFADLLLNTIDLLETNYVMRKHYQDLLKLICIDEYQDINDLQQKWMTLLLGHDNHLCCVGDPDQAIYGFRGANASHILGFNKYFQNAQVVKLECNYRSHQSILDNANKLISYNRNRIVKNLYSENKSDGKSVSIYSAPSAKVEASVIADKVIQLLSDRVSKSIALLIRSRVQLPDIEEALVSRQISYTIAGAIQFLDRAEVKDMLSYFRFLSNMNDSTAFRRMCQSPRRGLGQVTIDKIMEVSKEQGVNLLSATTIVAHNCSKSVKEKLIEFVGLIQDAMNMLGQGLYSTANFLYVKSGYIDSITEERRENVNQWMRSLTDFPSLDEYIQKVLWQIEQTNDEVDLHVMTIHASKGLEFDYTFLAGWEEGILPHDLAKSDAEIEEERRLAYVALTRARHGVFISYAGSRVFNGRLKQCLPSRFVRELVNVQYDSGSSTAIAIGTDVSHPRFGLGIVEQSTGEFARVRFLDTTRLVESRILRRL